MSIKHTPDQGDERRAFEAHFDQMYPMDTDSLSRAIALSFFKAGRASLSAAQPVAQPEPTSKGDVSRDLHTFLNAAAGEGFVLDGVDAADLYVSVFPERYAQAVEGLDAGTTSANINAAIEEGATPYAGELIFTPSELDAFVVRIKQEAASQQREPQEASKMEPVAWIHPLMLQHLREGTRDSTQVHAKQELSKELPLYLRPTQQALSDEDLDLLWLEHRPPGVSNEEQYRFARKFARAILAAANK